MENKILSDKEKEEIVIDARESMKELERVIKEFEKNIDRNFEKINKKLG